MSYRKWLVFVCLICLMIVPNINEKIYAAASYQMILEYYNSSAPNSTNIEQASLRFNEAAARANGEIVLAFSDIVGTNRYEGKFFEVATYKPTFNADGTMNLTFYYYIVKWPGNTTNGGTNSYGYTYPDKYIYVYIYNYDSALYDEAGNVVGGDLLGYDAMISHSITNPSNGSNRIYKQGVHRINSVTISNLPNDGIIVVLNDGEYTPSGEAVNKNCGDILGDFPISKEPNQYVINYDLQDGEWEGENPPYGYEESSEDLIIPQPYKQGYAFSGWMEKLSTSSWINARITPSTGIAAYSSSYPNAYTSEYVRVEANVTYTMNNIGTNKVDIHFYDANKNALPSMYMDSTNSMEFTPEENGYVRFCFSIGHSKGKSALSGLFNITANRESDITIYSGSRGHRYYVANWTIKDDIPYVVNHYLMDINGVYQLDLTEKLYGTMDSTIVPTQRNYGVGIVFNSEKSTITPITIKSDDSTVVNYYYDRVQYSILTNKDNGIESITGSGIYFFDEQVNMDAVVKKGYKWLKWSSNSNYLSGSTNQNYTFNMVSNNVTLTASSEIITYNISYDVDGGVLPTTYPVTYTVEDEVILPIPEKKGYIFEGWYEDGVFLEGIEKGSTGDKVLFAKYCPITYTIVYDGNGSQYGQMNPSIHVYDEISKLSVNKYEKENYKFLGWNDKQDGTGNNYDDEEEVLNLSYIHNEAIYLYAQYEKESYIINFDANGGSIPSFTILELKCGDALNKLPTTKQEGYAFDGWYTKKDAGIMISTSTIPTHDTTYYAHWTVIKPEITAVKKYYYQNSVVTIDMVKQNAQAKDCIDGDLSKEIQIHKLVYSNGVVVNNPITVDTTNLGDIYIEYIVTNKRFASESVVNTITIVKKDNEISDIGEAKIYSRFIANLDLDDGKNAKDSLNQNSIWNTEEYKVKLEKALTNQIPLENYEYINSSDFKNVSNEN